MGVHSGYVRPAERLVTRVCVVGLLAVLCFLAGFSILSQRHLAHDSQSLGQATDLGLLYADARFWVSQEESLARKFRLEPRAHVLALHAHAAAHLDADLNAVLLVDHSAATRRRVDTMLRAHAAYEHASAQMFAVVRRQYAALAAHPMRAAALHKLVLFDDDDFVDPVFTSLQSAVYAQSRRLSARAAQRSDAVTPEASSSARGIAAAFSLGLALLALFSLVLVRLRRGRRMPVVPRSHAWRR
jgi:hypothetical protein